MRLITLIAVISLTSSCATPFQDAPESFADASGETAILVEIGASPTPAWIFIDGTYVGTTPLQYEMSFSSDTAYLSVSAVPTNNTQTRQVKRIQVPPLPKRLHFFMNNAPETAASSGL